MTVGDLLQSMTHEEMVLWNVYFTVQHKEQKAAEKKARMRRR
jgi:hypothetical protein